LIAEEQERGESDTRRGPHWSYATAVDDRKNFGEFTCRKLHSEYNGNLGEIPPNTTRRNLPFVSSWDHVVSSNRNHPRVTPKNDATVER
jgi:hypothetical protein